MTYLQNADLVKLSLTGYFQYSVTVLEDVQQVSNLGVCVCGDAARNLGPHNCIFFNFLGAPLSQGPLELS